MRYGENPHQAAALYALPDAAPGSLVSAEKLHGKELSYNNLLDLDSALAVARSLPTPGVAVLKHNNPCGAATAATLGEAMRRAWEGDPLSAFGSVLGFNVPVDAAAAEFLAEPERFVEAIVAPDFTPEAFEILTTKPKWKANVRLLEVGEIEPGRGELELRQISGGMLCQTADDLPDDEAEWKVVTDAQPTDAQHGRLAVRLGRVPACEIERDRAGEGSGARRRRRRADEPRRFGGDRDQKSGRPGSRRGARLRRVLPVRRFDPPGRRGRRRGRSSNRAARAATTK